MSEEDSSSSDRHSPDTASEAKDDPRPGGAGHKEAQKSIFENVFSETRSHVSSDDELVGWLVRWRILTAVERVKSVAPDLTESSSVLVLCAGEGLEGSILCDQGFTDVTVSDITVSGVEQALKRDDRLKGLVLDAEDSGLPDASYDLVVVQDGLHHLRNPVLGFTEMLRLSRLAAFFLEPHDSFAGRLFGRTWERADGVANYVFRWNKGLVTDVAASYLGEGNHSNHSFAFWHHNPLMHRLGQTVSGGRSAKVLLKGMKALGPNALGNQFCGLVVHESPTP